MWVAPRRDPPPFRRDYFGVYGDVRADGIHVTHVSPLSPAAAAGLRPGDHVTAINGMPAAEANLQLRDAGPGTQLSLALAGGASRMVTLARYY